jgi:hypothetical protein
MLGASYINDIPKNDSYDSDKARIEVYYKPISDKKYLELIDSDDPLAFDNLVMNSREPLFLVYYKDGERDYNDIKAGDKNKIVYLYKGSRRWYKFWQFELILVDRFLVDGDEGRLGRILNERFGLNWDSIE